MDSFLHFIIDSKLFAAFLSSVLVVITFFLVGKILDSFIYGLFEILAGFIGYDGAAAIINYLMFVGVIHHELSHAIVAFLTGAKIVDIKLFNPSEKSLGSVSYYARGNIITRSLQATLASAAPVFCGFFTLSIIYRFVLGNMDTAYKLIIVSYVMVSIFFHMTMSVQDIKVALKGMPVTIGLLTIVFLILNFNYIQFIMEKRDFFFTFINRII